MAKTIIEWNGKRYQVVRGLDQRDDICLGCAFEGIPNALPMKDYYATNLIQSIITYLN